MIVTRRHANGGNDTVNGGRAVNGGGRDRSEAGDVSLPA